MQTNTQRKLTPKEAVIKVNGQNVIVPPAYAEKLNVPIIYTGTRPDCQKFIYKHKKKKQWKKQK